MPLKSWAAVPCRALRHGGQQVDQAAEIGVKLEQSCLLLGFLWESEILKRC